MRRPGLPFLVLVCVLASACAPAAPAPESPPDTGIDIAGIIIRNSLVYPVRDVMIEVPATGGFAGCGNILPRTDCRTSFQTVDYRQNPLKVSWTEYGVPQGTDAFMVEMPDRFGPGDTVWLEVVIYAPGLAGARLVQP